MKAREAAQNPPREVWFRRFATGDSAALQETGWLSEGPFSFPSKQEAKPVVRGAEDGKEGGSLRGGEKKKRKKIVRENDEAR